MIERSLAEIRGKTASLRAQLSRQELSQEQMEQIKKDSSAWRSKIDAAETQKRDLQGQIDALLSQIDATASQIDSFLAEYHALLLALQLAPASTPLAGGFDFRLLLEHVEDCGSVSSRDATQYERQLLRSTALERLDVDFRSRLERRACWETTDAASDARSWRCASRSCGWTWIPEIPSILGQGADEARRGGEGGGGGGRAGGEGGAAAATARRVVGSSIEFDGECRWRGADGPTEGRRTTRR